MTPFHYEARTRLFRGAGAVRRTGELARQMGARRALIVAEHGIVATGYASRVSRFLAEAGLDYALYSEFAANPDTDMTELGRQFAAGFAPDLIIGLGGGSSLDLAKAINFVLTNGGTMRDYWGYGKNVHPLLPMIGIPTTTGTGSEAQSYTLISDAATLRKMACGTPTAAFRAAILDPELCLSQPFEVRATAGFDAISHAVETWVTTRRTEFSAMLSREAWRLLSASFVRYLSQLDDLEALENMQWGAYLAGWAIEQSMLGAAHACANPLTQRYGTVHGRALAILMPAVVEWNSSPHYDELTPGLAGRLRDFIAAARLPTSLRQAGARLEDLPSLAERAAEQWTGTYNPRPLDAAGALEIYQCVF